MIAWSILVLILFFGALWADKILNPQPASKPTIHPRNREH